MSQGLIVALVIVGLFVAVLWVLLPFAVFGLKPLMREALAELRAVRAALERLRPPGG